MRRDIKAEAAKLEQQARDYVANPHSGFAAGYRPAIPPRSEPPISAFADLTPPPQPTAADWLRAIVHRDFPGARCRVVAMIGDAELEFLD
jgi:hypothetical protein